MSSKLARNAAAVATVIVLVVVAAGCGAAHARGTAPPSRNLAAAWHQVVVCARQHGMPGLQDPRIDDRTGKAIFPSGLNVPPETRWACQRLYDRLVPSGGDHPTPTAAQLAALVQFARCMRSHGIPDWPDPRPDGTFVPDARIANSLKSAFRGQLTACDHLNPDTRGRIYFSGP